VAVGQGVCEGSSRSRVAALLQKIFIWADKKQSAQMMRLRMCRFAFVHAQIETLTQPSVISPSPSLGGRNLRSALLMHIHTVDMI